LLDLIQHTRCLALRKSPTDHSGWRARRHLGIERVAFDEDATVQPGNRGAEAREHEC